MINDECLKGSFYKTKLQEYSAWYSGDPTVLANFYTDLLSKNIIGLQYSLSWDLFWARQIKNESEIGLHVPIAGDISTLSADLLFSESPLIRISEAFEENANSSFVNTQNELDEMLYQNGFYQKILECAETCSAMGGGFIKIAWDSAISKYPLLVVEQVDNSFPEFKFGILTKVDFMSVIKQDERKQNVFRLVETYANNGTITYKLYKGTDIKIGNEIDLYSIEETQGLENIDLGINYLLAVYIPNILPNRLERSSYIGRSDYSGLEGLMDSLDETYSSWMRDIAIAQGKILCPSEYLTKNENGFRYNLDKMVYAQLDIDPISADGKITPVQFAIRSDDFLKTTMELTNRIITSAGYSPQSLGLNINGSAESGTALNIRERRSIITKNKKENYWESNLKKIIQGLLLVYRYFLGGLIETDVNISIQFSDSLNDDIYQKSEVLEKIQRAVCASTETKVRYLHPEWSEIEIEEETNKILKENNMIPLEEPTNLDSFNLNNNIDESPEDELN